VLYADSSALVKRYLEERGSDKLNARIAHVTRARHRVLTSVLSFAEVHAAMARKLRERPPLQATEYYWATARLDSDWRTYLTRVDLTAVVLDLIPDLVKRHFLRGSDAVHLASALWVRGSLESDKVKGISPETMIFATSDKQLARAAEYEQLEVFDPEDAP
jgi:predicted nucleic acid-binding protein